MRFRIPAWYDSLMDVVAMILFPSRKYVHWPAQPRCWGNPGGLADKFFELLTNRKQPGSQRGSMTAMSVPVAWATSRNSASLPCRYCSSSCRLSRREMCGSQCAGLMLACLCGHRRLD
jgi:hypothetical protein